jgi:hypothetical protein
MELLEGEPLDARSDLFSLGGVFADGRRTIVPLTWPPRLMAATAASRANWPLPGDG